MDENPRGTGKYQMKAIEVHPDRTIAHELITLLRERGVNHGRFTVFYRIAKYGVFIIGSHRFDIFTQASASQSRPCR